MNISHSSHDSYDGQFSYHKHTLFSWCKYFQTFVSVDAEGWISRQPKIGEKIFTAVESYMGTHTNLFAKVSVSKSCYIVFLYTCLCLRDHCTEQRRRASNLLVFRQIIFHWASVNLGINIKSIEPFPQICICLQNTYFYPYSRPIWISLSWMCNVNRHNETKSASQSIILQNNVACLIIWECFKTGVSESSINKQKRVLRKHYRQNRCLVCLLFYS